jgi:predicted exporter
MIHLLLSALWDSAFAQFGLAGLVLAGAVALFLWVPLPGVRHIAVAVATVCVVFLFLAPKLYIEGIRHEKARWDAAEAAAAKRAARARAEAEREIAPVASGPASAPGPGPEAVQGAGGRALARILHLRGVRSDRYDRDNR